MNTNPFSLDIDKIDALAKIAVRTGLQKEFEDLLARAEKLLVDNDDVVSKASNEKLHFIKNCDRYKARILRIEGLSGFFLQAEIAEANNFLAAKKSSLPEITSINDSKEIVAGYQRRYRLVLQAITNTTNTETTNDTTENLLDAATTKLLNLKQEFQQYLITLGAEFKKYSEFLETIKTYKEDLKKKMQSWAKDTLFGIVFSIEPSKRKTMQYLHIIVDLLLSSKPELNLGIPEFISRSGKGKIEASHIFSPLVFFGENVELLKKFIDHGFDLTQQYKYFNVAMTLLDVCLYNTFRSILSSGAPSLFQKFNDNLFSQLYSWGEPADELQNTIKLAFDDKDIDSLKYVKTLMSMIYSQIKEIVDLLHSELGPRIHVKDLREIIVGYIPITNITEYFGLSQFRDSPLFCQWIMDFGKRSFEAQVKEAPHASSPSVKQNSNKGSTAVPQKDNELIQQLIRAQQSLSPTVANGPVGFPRPLTLSAASRVRVNNSSFNNRHQPNIRGGSPAVQGFSQPPLIPSANTGVLVNGSSVNNIQTMSGTKKQDTAYYNETDLSFHAVKNCLKFQIAFELEKKREYGEQDPETYWKVLKAFDLDRTPEELVAYFQDKPRSLTNQGPF